MGMLEEQVLPVLLPFAMAGVEGFTCDHDAPDAGGSQLLQHRLRLLLQAILHHQEAQEHQLRLCLLSWGKDRNTGAAVLSWKQAWLRSEMQLAQVQCSTSTSVSAASAKPQVPCLAVPWKEQPSQGAGREGAEICRTRLAETCRLQHSAWLSITVPIHGHTEAQLPAFIAL